MNALIESFNNGLLALGTLFTLIATVYSAVQLIKWKGNLDKRRETAESERSIVEDNLGGKASIHTQLDELEAAVVNKTNHIVRLIEEVHLLTNSNFNWVTFAKRVVNDCQDYCEETDKCVEQVYRRLDELGLREYVENAVDELNNFKNAN